MFTYGGLNKAPVSHFTVISQLEKSHDKLKKPVLWLKFGLVKFSVPVQGKWVAAEIAWHTAVQWLRKDSDLQK
jgi:hypothetical protein